MNYYEVAIIKYPLILTYQFAKELKIYQVVKVPLKNKIVEAVVLKKVKKPSFKSFDITPTPYFFDLKQIELAKFISNYYLCHFSEAISIFTPFKEEKKVSKDLDFNLKPLSKIQQDALDFFKKQNISLLFADTGSGKTEIYMHKIKEILLDKRQVLFLMPEISLTPQMEQRLKSVFGDSVAIWHSKVTKKRKEKIVLDLLSNKIKIIAGARSALFLPFENLGLIIVDEEHDEAYKSNQKPKINVKDLSCYYAKKFNITTILGSATPSLNSYFKFKHFRIKGTFFNTKRVYHFVDNSEFINPKILTKIKNTLDNNKQVIIFLPTRANFKYQICDNCGKSLECPFCSVSLSLHLSKNMLMCHYCNYTMPIISQCPSCRVGILKNYRIGTSEVKERLDNIFQNVNIAKFDKDEVTTQNKLKKILKDFNDKKIDILVGTQMLSKGHDYPNVSLVVVLGIDSILKMSRYNAREKALSLFKQISGRSARKEIGEVIVQTSNSEFFKQYEDYEEFLKEELIFRKDLYPPYVRFAKITFAHKNYKIALNAMNEVVEKIKGLNNKDVEIIGYKESEIFKIANKYHYEILLRSKNIKSLLSVINYAKNDLAIIDIDPI